MEKVDVKEKAKTRELRILSQWKLDIDAEMKGVVERFKDMLYANVLLSSITYSKEEE
ncbi:MAG: hypothetical protein K0R75_2306, partial [Paenibacillaceae bacterium]|nr:hypothetical protein [Paenibacillaceae bacterium]